MASQKQAVNIESARQALRRGDRRTAEDLCRRIIKKKPKNIEAYRLLAMVCVQTRRIEEAIAILERALNAQPRDISSLMELGRCLRAQGNLSGAIEVFKRVIELKPSETTAYLLAADLYSSLNEPSSARKVLETGLGNVAARDAAPLKQPLALMSMSSGMYTRAIELFEECVEAADDGKRPLLLAHLGTAQRMAGEYDEALAHYEEALEREPQCAEALAGKIEVLDLQGHMDAVKQLLQTHVIERKVRNDDLAVTFARIAPKVDLVPQAIEYVTEQVEDPRCSRAMKITLSYSLGDLLEKAGRFDDAFKAWTQANRMYASSFQEDAFVKGTDASIEVFQPEALVDLARAPVEDRPPVFIVGMMRSGTSLLEQMLSCHPEVAAGGELQVITLLASRVSEESAPDAPYPLALRNLSEARLTELASEVRAVMDQIDADKPVRTDKLPVNYVHLGFIWMMFPNARILHCRRHPLDVCLSCFANRLLPIHRYATDLVHSGIAFREYDRMMNHWKDVLDLPILDVRYESLIEEPERAMREVLEFLNLEWDPACLEFHKSQRVARTASIDQVRQPIYKSSRGRYERFDKHLGPLRAVLGDLVDSY